MSRRILKHLNSNELVGNKAKLPTAEVLEHGEIAINYAKGNETIALKNSENEIVSMQVVDTQKLKTDVDNLNNMKIGVLNYVESPFEKEQEGDVFILKMDRNLPAGEYVFSADIKMKKAVDKFTILVFGKNLNAATLGTDSAIVDTKNFTVDGTTKYHVSAKFNATIAFEKLYIYPQYGYARKSDEARGHIVFENMSIQSGNVITNDVVHVGKINSEIKEAKKGLLKRKIFDFSKLDPNKFYPLVVQHFQDIGTFNRSRYVLRSYFITNKQKPPYATHERGFETYLEWSSALSKNGSAEIDRQILVFNKKFVPNDLAVCSEPNQVIQYNAEYVYVRGGWVWELSVWCEQEPMFFGYSETGWSIPGREHYAIAAPKDSVTEPKTIFTKLKEDYETKTNSLKGELTALKAEVEKLKQK